MTADIVTASNSISHKHFCVSISQESYVKSNELELSDIKQPTN